MRGGAIFMIALQMNTYQYTNRKGQLYYLHSKKVILKGSKKEMMINYFSRKLNAQFASELPKNWKVVENQRTGLPFLKKIV